jgi:hypothetical protein
MWIFDPRIFNYILIALYFLAAVRFAFDKNWIQTGYMISAMSITIFVTLMKG